MTATTAMTNMTHTTNQIEIIARGVMIHTNYVLLCRNMKHGYHFLPGGHVEFGEPAAVALKREFTEECGLPVAVGKLLLTHEHIYTRKSGPRHEVNLVFHVERGGAVAGEVSQPIRSKEPKIEFDWISSAELGTIELRPRSMQQWLATRAATWISEA